MLLVEKIFCRSKVSKCHDYLIFSGKHKLLNLLKEALVTTSTLDLKSCRPSLITSWPKYVTADAMIAQLLSLRLISALQSSALLRIYSSTQPESFLWSGYHFSIWYISIGTMVIPKGRCNALAKISATFLWVHVQNSGYG